MNLLHRVRRLNRAVVFGRGIELIVFLLLGVPAWAAVGGRFFDFWNGPRNEQLIFAALGLPVLGGLYLLFARLLRRALQNRALAAVLLSFLFAILAGGLIARALPAPLFPLERLGSTAQHELKLITRRGPYEAGESAVRIQAFHVDAKPLPLSSFTSLHGSWELNDGILSGWGQETTTAVTFTGLNNVRVILAPSKVLSIQVILDDQVVGWAQHPLFGKTLTFQLPLTRFQIFLWVCDAALVALLLVGLALFFFSRAGARRSADWSATHWRELLLAAAAVVQFVLFATFYLYQGFAGEGLFQFDSNTYIYNKVISPYTAAEDFARFGGFFYKNPEIPYRSQVGPQGMILGAIPKLFNLDRHVFLAVSRLVFVLALCVIFYRLALSVLRELGLVTALALMALVSGSVWIGAASKSLMFVFFLHVLPFVVGWVVYPRVLKGSTPWGRFLFWVGLTVFLKALNGYEYIPNIILSPTVAMLFFWLRDRQESFKRFVQRVIWTGAAGGAGLAAALFTHFVQLSLNMGGVARAADYLINRTVYRTMGEQNSVCNNSSLPKLVYDYMFNVSYVPFQQPTGNIPPSMIWHLFALLAVGLVIGAALLVFLPGERLQIGAQDAGRNTGWQTLPLLPSGWAAALRALAAAAVWSLVCSFAWIVIFLNHMNCHYHFDALAFYLPFGLTVFIFAGYVLRLLLAPLKLYALLLSALRADRPTQPEEHKSILSTKK